MIRMRRGIVRVRLVSGVGGNSLYVRSMNVRSVLFGARPLWVVHRVSYF
jgi:hypothetical protein